MENKFNFCSHDLKHSKLGSGVRRKMIVLTCPTALMLASPPLRPDDGDDCDDGRGGGDDGYYQT